MADSQLEPQTSGSASEPESSLLDEMVRDGMLELVTPPSADTRQRDNAVQMLRKLADQLVEGAIQKQEELDAKQVIDRRIAELDSLISTQLNAVMHAPEFKKLEASWRGLHFLVSRAELGGTLRMKVLDVGKNELLSDLRNIHQVQQSTLWRKVYEHEFGTLGGDPFGMMVADYEFSASAQDIRLLQGLSKVAAGAHSPFIASAAPQMFGMKSFTEFAELTPGQVSERFRSADYAEWDAFRKSEDSRYVGLTMPGVMLRLPYGPDTEPVEAFDFKEDVAGRNHDKYLWGNAAYAFASRVADAFAKYGWCTAIRGVEGGGLVDNLPAHTFKTDRGAVAMKCPTEVALPERIDNELSENGFIPLVHYKQTNTAAFLGVQSANKPTTYREASATASARLSSQLPYLFAASRIAHYLKVIVRDKVGSFMSRAEVESFLNSWLKGYVLLNDTAPQETKAKYPLAAARVTVEDVPGRPGAYRAVADLRPHYQLDQIDVALRLVADLPEPVGS